MIKRQIELSVKHDDGKTTTIDTTIYMIDGSYLKSMNARIEDEKKRYANRKRSDKIMEPIVSGRVKLSNRDEKRSLSRSCLSHGQHPEYIGI